MIVQTPSVPVAGKSAATTHRSPSLPGSNVSWIKPLQCSCSAWTGKPNWPNVRLPAGVGQTNTCPRTVIWRLAKSRSAVCGMKVSTQTRFWFEYINWASLNRAVAYLVFLPSVGASFSFSAIQPWNRPWLRVTLALQPKLECTIKWKLSSGFRMTLL